MCNLSIYLFSFLRQVSFLSLNLDPEGGKRKEKGLHTIRMTISEEKKSVLHAEPMWLLKDHHDFWTAKTAKIAS